jgi:hypothetical protein
MAKSFLDRHVLKRIRGGDVAGTMIRLIFVYRALVVATW